MKTVATLFQILVACIGILASCWYFWDSFDDVSRLRPFSRFGWRNEMHMLSLGIGLPASLLLMSSGRNHAKAPYSRICASLLMAIAAACGFLRYFYLSLAVISAGGFLLTWLLSIATPSGGRRYGRRLLHSTLFALASMWMLIVVASYTLVGA